MCFLFSGELRSIKRMAVRCWKNNYTLWFFPKLASVPEEALNMKSTCSAKVLLCSVKSKLEGCQELWVSSLVKSPEKKQGYWNQLERKERKLSVVWCRNQNSEKLKSRLLPFEFLYISIPGHLGKLMCYPAVSLLMASYIVANHFIWFLLPCKFFMKLPLDSVYSFRYNLSNIFLEFFSCRNILFPWWLLIRHVVPTLQREITLLPFFFMLNW